MNQIVTTHDVSLAQPFVDRLDDGALDKLFREARTHNAWLDQPVSHKLLEEAVELAKMAPTAANSSPLRIVFVESREAKELLKPALADGNKEKTMAAPVTAILGHDLAFYEFMPKLLPHVDARSWYVGNATLAEQTATQSATLQAAYLILAVRSLGLDAGPMGGFDKDKVDAAFFAGTNVKSNLLVNIGYGDHTKLFPRNPRLDFAEIARFA